MTESTPDCCEVWKHIRKRFSWFDFDDEPDCSAMPSLLVHGTYWRINFCPSCGAKRRAVIWNRKDD